MSEQGEVHVTKRPTLFALVFCVLLSPLIWAQQSPKIIWAGDRVLKGLPASEFVPKEIVFFRDNLYVGCDAGVMEIAGGSFRRLFQWETNTPIAGGPWLDKASDSLWVATNDKWNLSHSDGHNWQTSRGPRPKRRDDLLRGLSATSNSSGFWLLGARHVWRWGTSSWKSEAFPKVAGTGRDRTSYVCGLMPTGDALYFVLRDGREPPSVLETVAEEFGWYDRLNPDCVFYAYKQGWRSVSNNPVRFFTVDTAATQRAGYIRSKQGGLFEVTTNHVCKLLTPGFCEAIATDQATLVASFHNSGVFELNHEWQQVAKPPYEEFRGPCKVHLAISGTNIAFSVSALPQVRHGTILYEPESGLWILTGLTWKQVLLPPVPHQN